MGARKRNAEKFPPQLFVVCNNYSPFTRADLLSNFTSMVLSKESPLLGKLPTSMVLGYGEDRKGARGEGHTGGKKTGKMESEEQVFLNVNFTLDKVEMIWISI